LEAYRPNIMFLFTLLLSLLPVLISGHGHLTLPPSRNGGNVQNGGACDDNACFWFSNNVEIPGNATLPDKYRTVNRDAVGEDDIFKTSPWRAPGTAPVYGSGCGAGWGGPVGFANGGYAKDQSMQGFDAVKLDGKTSERWKLGSVQKVAWGISANHGGGYAYRLCPNNGKTNITEECFQAHHLEFEGDLSWIIDNNDTMVPFNRTTVNVGTFPEGSQWAMSPIPGCNTCSEGYVTKCGKPLDPVPGNGKSDWNNQVDCYAICDGAGSSKKSGACPEGTENYPPSAKEYSGFGKYMWAWSIMDRVKIPETLTPGRYLISWRWDCEESTQVWQNCGDVLIY